MKITTKTTIRTVHILPEDDTPFCEHCSPAPPSHSHKTKVCLSTTTTISHGPLHLPLTSNPPPPQQIQITHTISMPHHHHHHASSGLDCNVASAFASIEALQRACEDLRRSIMELQGEHRALAHNHEITKSLLTQAKARIERLESLVR
jgi:hypothetical protein